MFYQIKQYEDFYNSREGRVVRHTLKKTLDPLFDGTKGRVIGLGYASPYIGKNLSLFSAELYEDGARVNGYKGRDIDNISFAHLHRIPLETSSVDVIVMVHGLEYSFVPDEVLKDIFRVLKSEGKFILVVPNRAGLWTNVSWAPFGHGHPFSSTQLKSLLEKSNFKCERICSALYFPPFRKPFIYNMANILEKYGQSLLSAFGGVNVAVARKKTYATIKPSKGTAVPVRTSKAIKPTVARAESSRLKSK